MTVSVTGINTCYTNHILKQLFNEWINKCPYETSGNGQPLLLDYHQGCISSSCNSYVKCNIVTEACEGDAITIGINTPYTEP